MVTISLFPFSYTVVVTAISAQSRQINIVLGRMHQNLHSSICVGQIIMACSYG